MVSEAGVDSRQCTVGKGAPLPYLRAFKNLACRAHAERGSDADRVRTARAQGCTDFVDMCVRAFAHPTTPHYESLILPSAPCKEHIPILSAKGGGALTRSALRQPR